MGSGYGSVGRALLPTPEVLSSNLGIGKKLCVTFTCHCIKNTKIQKKRPGMAQFKKNFTYDPRLTESVVWRSLLAV